MPYMKDKFQPVPALPPTNLHTFMFEMAPGNQVPHDHVQYIDGLTGESWTRADFVERVRDGATALAAPVRDGGLGLSSKGAETDQDIVAIFTQNCLDFSALVHACLAAAVPFALLPSKPTTFELNYLLRKAGATRLFVHPTLLAQALEAAQKVGLPKDRIYLLGGRDKSGHRLDFGTLVENVRRKKIPRRAVVPTKKDQLAYLVFSSGTSGLPKGVMISHDNVIFTLLQMLVMAQESMKQFPPAEAGPLPIWLNFLPLYHSFGLHYTVFRPLIVPNTLVILPNWSLDKALEAIPKYKVTHLPLVPSIIHQIVHSPKAAKTDFSSVAVAASGAAHLPPSLSERFSKMIKASSTVIEGYGMSEATIGSMFRPTNGMFGLEYPPNCTGIIIASTEARIVREDGTDANYNEVGELWIRGRNIALGYWRDDEATRNTFLPDGWLRTGDRFRVDENDVFFYEDRLKDTLKISGAQVAPAEIELALLAQPDGLIVDAAVAGIPGKGRTSDERVPRAWVIPSEQGKKIGEKELKHRLDTWVRQQLSRIKWLTGGIEVVQEIPKNPTGKVLRRVLVEDYARRTGGRTNAKL